MNAPRAPATAADIGTRGAASEWITRWSHLVRPGGRVLDVACGQGRHLHWFAQQGCHATGIDRSAPALAESAALAASGGATLIEADIENGPWPLGDAAERQRFDAVVVTHYLWRPLLPTLLDSVVPGGVLLYETFSVDHAAIGRPARPEFLLQHGELLRLCAGWQIVAYEDGYREHPPGYVQRIAAIRPPSSAGFAAGTAVPYPALRNQR